MDSLKCLNKESIELLRSNGLLARLVKFELLKEIINKVLVSDEKKEELKQLFCERNNIEDERSS